MITKRFKFRIWDKENKQFNVVDFGSHNNECIDFSGIDDNDITQFTGKCDKNGNEIYERDILRVKRSFVRPYITDDVEIGYKFSEGDEEIGYLYWDVFGCKYIVSYEHIRHDDSEDFSGVSHRIEVIGNIYEHPQIVKYEKD
jgi:uncharacterized phage protein (TIGR01671 family)